MSADAEAGVARVAMDPQLWAARIALEGLVVHEVRPGVVDTDMIANAAVRYDALFANGLEPMRRWGRPADVGQVVGMLASAPRG